MALPPSWDRTNLPEEEIQVLERVPPPQVDRKEHSTGKWILAAPTIVKEEILNNNEEIKLPRKQEALNNNDLDDSTEVTVLDSSCVIRYAMYRMCSLVLKKGKLYYSSLFFDLHYKTPALCNFILF